ncbi:hypothetical protein, partial [Thermanaerothrix sp.]|uniref:hypothetical protein n=1 Tax=Thermanaerothrix sp. TaxID=2972675 RepID=UPI003C7A02EA
TAYVMRRGGSVSLMLQYSGQIRVNQLPSGVEETSFTFLTYAMLGITSALILVGLRQKSLFLSVLALLFIGESGLVLWMRAGRLHLINFVLVLCLIYFSKKPRWFQLVGVFMALGALWLIFYYGKYLTRVTFVLDTPNDLMGHLQLVASEMAFPYLSLANVIENGATWRLFMDIPLGLLYVFVNPAVRVFSGSPLDLVPSVAKVNTESLIGTAFWGEIPVDIVTFGYYNGGPIGVVVTCFLWGVLISWFERALPEGVTGVTSALRFAFIVFLSTVGTVYSDPVNVLRDGLYLVVPFLTLFGLMWLQPQRARGKVVRVSSV